MRGVWLGVLGALVLGAGAWLGWKHFAPAYAARDLRRDLAVYDVLRLPDGLPDEWLTELATVLAVGPRVSLADAHSAEAAAELLREVSWIDPASVRADLFVPEGVRVRFEAREPVLKAARTGKPGPLVAADGTALPLGPPAESLAALPFVELTPGLPAAVPGRRFADPLVQEALAALDEYRALADLLRQQAGIELHRIERAPDYPVVSDVPPSLCFVTAAGTEIVWGRSAATADPHGVPLEQKATRLRFVLERYPRLEGVRRILLDRPVLQVLGPELQPLWPAATGSS